MQKSTMIAMVLAPLLAPAVRWAMLQPGRRLTAYLQRRIQSPKLRSIVFKRIW
jgi:hypothetical protein